MSIRTYLTLAATAIILAACGSSKNATQSAASQQAQQILQTSAANNKNNTGTTQQTVTSQQQAPTMGLQKFVADIDLGITMGNDRYDLGGKMYMKRGEVMRLNLTFMGFIEVGIIEFTPDDILVVNRMGKEYTRVRYDQVEEMRKNNISYTTIENMVWEKLNPTAGQKISNGSFDKLVEDMINSNIKSSKKIKVNINIGKPNTSKDFETKTQLSSRYTEVPAQVLMSSLMKFAQ